MGLYISQNEEIKQVYPAIKGNYYSVFFGYCNVDGEIKQFLRPSDVIDYVEFRMRTLWFDKTSSSGDNPEIVKKSDISGYGSVIAGSNYIEVDCTRSSSWICCGVDIIVHTKADTQNLDINFLCGDLFDGVIDFSVNLTGYVKYRTSTSESAQGYMTNRSFGVIVANESASTSSTVTKTIAKSEAELDYYGIEVGTGRTSGSQTLISKMTINSITIDGKSFPIVITDHIDDD